MQFDHVAQQVPDIAAAVGWYRDFFADCEVVYQDETWAMLTVGGVRLAFVLAEQHPAHLAWRVSPERLRELASEHGQAVRGHRDGSESFYLEGPGGQAIEIVAYPPS